jgi:hypothetical protein
MPTFDYSELEPAGASSAIQEQKVCASITTFCVWNLIITSSFHSTKQPRRSAKGSRTDTQSDNIPNLPTSVSISTARQASISSSIRLVSVFGQQHWSVYIGYCIACFVLTHNTGSGGRRCRRNKATQFKFFRRQSAYQEYPCRSRIRSRIRSRTRTCSRCNPCWIDPCSWWCFVLRDPFSNLVKQRRTWRVVESGSSAWSYCPFYSPFKPSCKSTLCASIPRQTP